MYCFNKCSQEESKEERLVNELEKKDTLLTVKSEDLDNVQIENDVQVKELQQEILRLRKDAHFQKEHNISQMK